MNFVPVSGFPSLSQNAGRLQFLWLETAFHFSKAFTGHRGPLDSYTSIMESTPILSVFGDLIKICITLAGTLLILMVLMIKSLFNRVKQGSNCRSVRAKSSCTLKAPLKRTVATAQSRRFLSFESWLSLMQLFRSFIMVAVTGSLVGFKDSLAFILSRLLAPVSICLTCSGRSTGISMPLARCTWRRPDK